MVITWQSLLRSRSLSVICLALILIGAAVSVSSAVEAERPLPDLKAGKAAYGQYCARCHGEAGKGDGVDAKRFYPRPRDFTVGRYKFRTTASETPPSDEDLFRTISFGLPGTNMPDWQQLDETTRWQLVHYLKSLAPQVFEQTKPTALDVSPDPGQNRVDLKKGRAIYQKLGCAACHGTHGRADGTSAAGLVDDWGMPIRPANLTQGWAYRGGHDARAIVTRVLAGIDGVGMPSYASALAAMPDLSAQDVWQLGHYVASLQEEPHWNMIAHAASISGPLPETLDDARWAQAERTTVRMRNVVTPEGEWKHPPTVRAIDVQVVYNEDAVAFRLTWDDPTQDLPDVSNRAQAGAQNPPDGLAVVLKPSSSQGDVVTLQTWPYAGAQQLDLSYWSAGDQVTEAVAADFETVLTSTAPAGTLRAKSKYEDGRWTLLLQRPLAPTSPAGALVIAPEEFMPVAFTVWDGGNAHARAVSPWIDFVLRKRNR